jgi:CubicO group peptidase (beta-lactamase class C family)
MTRILTQFVLIAGTAGLLIAGSCGSRTELNSSNRTRIVDTLNSVMKDSSLPAVVALAVNSRGERIEYSKGAAIWSEAEPVTPDHIFRIFSMTKLVTTIAALQLVEQGKIGLHDDLSAVLPEMDSIPILSEGALKPASNPITLHHLLTHTSGFGYTVTDEQLSKFDTKNWKYRDHPRRFEAGSKFLYGSSTDWAGKLVEKLSDENLEVYFRNHITGPLAMDRTWFVVPDSLQHLVVSNGWRGEDGSQPLTETERTDPQPVTTFSGGGGLFSSPNDYLRLLQCLLNFGELDGVRILKKETVEDMRQNKIGDIRLTWSHHKPAYCCNFDGIFDDSARWGYGWMIDNEDRPYGPRAGTVLWAGLMNTYFFIDYNLGIAASIYTQHLPFNHPETTDLFKVFSEQVYRYYSE